MQASRGTFEQLYLCIRLGYVRHYEQQQRAELPLLMDDVAVNFDPGRMSRTFEALGLLCAAGQQVLFFTCHEELIHLLPQGTNVFRIRDFAFSLYGEP